MKIKLKDQEIDWTQSQLVKSITTGVIVLVDNSTKIRNSNNFLDEGMIFCGTVINGTSTKGATVGDYVTDFLCSKFIKYVDSVTLSNK